MGIFDWLFGKKEIDKDKNTTATKKAENSNNLS